MWLSVGGWGDECRLDDISVCVCLPVRYNSII